MHDLKFANEIISAVKSKIKKTGSAISGDHIIVKASISPLVHVKPEGLTETFKAIAEHEGLGAVKLRVRLMDLEINCRNCGAITKHSSPAFKCPECDSCDFDIITEQEFRVDSIELYEKREGE